MVFIISVGGGKGGDGIDTGTRMDMGGFLVFIYFQIRAGRRAPTVAPALNMLRGWI